MCIVFLVSVAPYNIGVGIKGVNHRSTVVAPYDAGACPLGVGLARQDSSQSRAEERGFSCCDKRESRRILFGLSHPFAGSLILAVI